MDGKRDVTEELEMTGSEREESEGATRLTE